MFILLIILSYFEPLEWIEYRDYRYITSIDADIRWVWVASTEGILRYDKLREKWEIPGSRETFPDNIRVIALDEFSDYIWLITSTDLWHYHPILKDIEKFPLPKKTTSPLISFTGEYVYINMEEDYYRFDRLSGEFEETEPLQGLDWKPKSKPRDFTQLTPYFVQDKKLRIYYMTCVIPDESYLWVGTEGMGIIKYDIYTLQNEHINFGVPVRGVRALHANNDNVWIGGDTNILTLWNREKNIWQYFDLSDYSIYTTGINEIDTDDKSVWLATREGLIRYDYDEFRIYNVFDGLPSENITSIEAEGEDIWVGTDWGLSKIVNDRVITEDMTDGIRINDLQLFGDSLLIATPYGAFVKHGEELTRIADSTGILGTGVTVMAGKELLATKLGVLTEKGRMLTYPVDLPDPYVYVIKKTPDAFWFGTEKGAVKFDKNFSFREIFNSSNSPIKGAVYTILVFEESVLFGTESGMIEFLGI